MMRISTLFLLACASLAVCQVTELRQADFADGTVVLQTAGTYRLMEDVTFNPNSVASLNTDSYHAGDVQMSQFTFAGGVYNPAAFGIGFFAAVAIGGDGITLDLNGHTLRQSKEHALQQRFYANIEMASTPFIASQGPHNFGTPTPATNCVVKNGVLGRSSHHGIHGNGAINVTISDLVIEDFEVAGIALNGALGLTVTDVVIQDSRTDVPILGTFSAGRFLRPYVDFLAASSQTTLTVQGVALSASDIQSALRSALNNVFDDVITQDRGEIDGVAHPDEFALFHNEPAIIDGSVYGLLLNQLGLAIGGFPVESEISNPSDRVLLQDITVRNLRAAPNEVLALSRPNGVIVDAVGALFQVHNDHPTTGLPVTISSFDDSQAEYLGNVVSNAQALVAKAKLNGDFANSNLDVSRINFPAAVLEWIEATPATAAAKLSTVTDTLPFICNGDSMFHAMKGVIGFKLDGSDQVTVRNVRVTDVSNEGKVGSEVCGYTPSTFSHPDSVVPGYGGAILRGFSVAGSFDVVIEDAFVADLVSTHGSTIGVDIITDSHMVTCIDCVVDGLSAGTEGQVSDYTNNPTEVPIAVGFRVTDDARDVNLDSYRVSGLSAIGSAEKLVILGGDVFATEADSSSSGSSGSSSSGSSSGSSSSGSSGSSSSDSSALIASCGLLAVAMIAVL